MIKNAIELIERMRDLQQSFNRVNEIISSDELFAKVIDKEDVFEIEEKYTDLYNKIDQALLCIVDEYAITETLDKDHNKCNCSLCDR